MVFIFILIYFEWRDTENQQLVDFVTLIVQSYFDTLLRYDGVISDILWSSCYESYGPKDTR